MRNPVNLLQKARKAVRIAREIENFTDVYSHLILNKELHQIRLRNKIKITAGKDIDLWRHFHDIWLFEVYTRDYNPILQDSVVIDIGASVGVFSLFAAARGARVFAYEPDPDSFESLSGNVHNNGNLQIRAYQYALASNQDSRILYLYPERTGNSFYHRSNGPGPGKTRVECRRLAGILDENAIRQCDFMKINCEGAEFEILLSASKESLLKIKSLIVECHDQLTDYSHQDVLEYLNSLGYQTSISLTRKDNTTVLLAKQID